MSSIIGDTENPGVVQASGEDFSEPPETKRDSSPYPSANLFVPLVHVFNCILNKISHNQVNKNGGKICLYEN